MPVSEVDSTPRLRLDAVMEARVRAFAEARGLSPEQVLREAVEEYLALPERHPVGGIITPV